jgi:polar amino acid transport system substrate-binding protein
MKKNWSLLGFIIVMGFLFTFTWVIPGHADDSVARVKKAGELVIASTVTGVPTTFLNTKTNEVQGTMVDVAKHIADKLGVKLKVVETPWSALIPSLTGKKVDLICAAMIITEKRKEVIDFSDPILPYCDAMIVKLSDKKPYKTINDIQGLRVGAQVGTFYAKGLEERGIKGVKIYDNIGEIMMDITNDRLDASIVDAPVAGYLVKTKPEFKVRIVETYQPAMCGDLGIGIRKDDQDLKKEINKIVAEMKRKGMIKEILTKWGQ